MKKIWLWNIFLILFCITSSSAQILNTDSLDCNVKKERKEIRQQVYQQAHDELSKYFQLPPPRSWYFYTNVGYGFPFLTNRLESPLPFLGISNYYQNANGQINDEIISGTNGKGVRYGLGFGKMFNPFIGFDLYVYYSKFKETLLGNVNTPTYKSSLTIDAIDLSISPHLLLQTPNLNNFYMYAKLGFTMPVFGYAYTNVSVIDKEARMLGVILQDDLILGPLAELLQEYGITQEIAQNLDYELSINARTKSELIDGNGNIGQIIKSTIGISSSLGVKYQISSALSVHMEMRFTGYNLSPANNRVEKLSGNLNILGADISIAEEFFPYGTFNIDFKQSLDENSNNPNYNPSGYDDTIAREELAAKLSTSALSLHVGIQINFKGRKSKK